MDAIDVITSLRGLGVPIELSEDPEPSSFLPGVWMDRGTLKVHLASIRAPGDIFHEAGHLALIPPMFRSDLRSGDLESEVNHKAMGDFLDQGGLLRYPECPVARAILQCGEAEAIAWSYAAALEVGYPTLKVFVHDNVSPENQPYEGDGAELELCLSMGSHFGVNGLCHAKMCEFRQYPKLRIWMQDATLTP